MCVLWWHRRDVGFGHVGSAMTNGRVQRVCLDSGHALTDGILRAPCARIAYCIPSPSGSGVISNFQCVDPCAKVLLLGAVG